MPAVRVYPALVSVIAATAWCVAASTPVLATSAAAHSTHGSLHSGSGGTGTSAGGGSGGTGLSSHGSAGGGKYKGVGAKTPTGVSSPASNTQQTMVPAKSFSPPPAGVRPHTDLAAANKLVAHSSASLVKHSQLFPRQHNLPGDPTLSGPVLNAIGPTTGGSASFKKVAGFSVAESNANISPANFKTTPAKLQTKSLSSGGASTALAAAAATDEPAAPGGQGGGWLLNWLTNAMTLAGIIVLGLWMWRQAPRGAPMTLPARIAA